MSSAQVVEYSKFPDIKQIVHICAECIVISVLFVYFQNKFKKFNEGSLIPIIKKLKESETRIEFLEQTLQNVIAELEQVKKVSHIPKKKVKFVPQPKKPEPPKVVEEDTDDEVENKKEKLNEPEIEDVEDEDLDKEIEAELNERFESTSLKKQK